MSLTTEKKSVSEEKIFDLDAPPKDPLNEDLRQICIYTDLNTREKKTKLEEEWNIRMTCTQEWFIRCSSINKYSFLELLCKSTSGLIVLENILKSIESIFSKDFLESNSNTTKYAYDKFPIDDNRALDEEDLNRAMKEGFVWFINMDYSNQVRVILRLLRLGGGSLIFMIYKLIEKIIAERRTASEYLNLLKKGDSTEAKPRVNSRAEEVVLINKDNLSDGDESLKESILRKQFQLERRNTEFLNYKKLRGILDEEGNETKSKDAEAVDYLQILPISLNRRIMSYIDEKTLSGLRKVGRYWSKMIDESINEKSARKAINAKINRIIGIKADKEEKKKEEKGRKVELKLIKELGSRFLINAKKENERTLIMLQERYKDILSTKCNIKTLNTSFHPERCGACGNAVLACSTPSNLVYFYSLKTGARLNFIIFGLESKITCISLHENNIHIFIGCKDGSVVAKDFRTNNTTATFKSHKDVVLSIFTTSSNFLTGSKDNTVKYFQLWTGVCLLCINLNPELHISSVLLRNDKPHLVAIGTEEGILALANLSTKSLLSKVKLHSDEIKQLAHDEDFLITGSGNGKIRIWNMNHFGVNWGNPQPYYDINMESPVTCLKFFENQIFCGAGNGTIKVISLATGKIFKSLNVFYETPIRGLDVTKDKTVLKLVIWHETGAEIRTFSLQKPPPKKPLKEKGNLKSGERKSKNLEEKRHFKMVSDDYIRNISGSLETVPGLLKTTTYEGNKISLNDRCCTISTLRIQRPRSSQFKTDIFAEVYNAGFSKSSGFLLCTFPRNLNVNPK